MPCSLAPSLTRQSSSCPRPVMKTVGLLERFGAAQGVYVGAEAL